MVWDRDSGLPVHNAIVWQCRRTSEITDALIADGMSDIIRDKTGLMPDPYFSGTKIKWILDNVDVYKRQVSTLPSTRGRPRAEMPRPLWPCETGSFRSCAKGHWRCGRSNRSA